VRITPLSTRDSPCHSLRLTIGLPDVQSLSVSTPKNHCLISSAVVRAAHTFSIGPSMKTELSVVMSLSVRSS
jgi:hypothetical protein